MTTLSHPTGARLLIDALLAQGVDTVFCVPGESFLDAMDALYDHRDSVRLIVCRHEGSATFMAEAYAKASGKPGVCFVTRAPGASQASIGLHTAFQDGTPLILFIGQVSRRFMERGAFQEVDYRIMFGPVSKWVAQIDQPERLGEMVHRAFPTALSGRMGPVVLALPEDVLSEAVAQPPHAAMAASAPASAPQANDLATLMQWLQVAHKPLLVLGGSGWNAQAVAALRRFVHATGLPVACSFRRQDLFDHRDPHYVGLLGLGADPGLLRAVKEADLLILLGARMGEVPSQSYSLIDIPQPQQTLVHAMPCVKELGRVYRPHLAILSSMPALTHSLAELAVPLVPHLVEQQRQRFLERWKDAMALADGSHLPEAAQDRALTEATAFAIRIDVAEELTRLRSHLDELSRLLTKGGDIGKRLDFLIQELHREANTLGSKSAVLEMTRISVDMKVLIEQMREQVQNIE